MKETERLAARINKSADNVSYVLNFVAWVALASFGACLALFLLACAFHSWPGPMSMVMCVGILTVIIGNAIFGWDKP